MHHPSTLPTGLIDEAWSIARTPGETSLTQVYRHGGHTIRILIRSSPDLAKSSATAAVLTPALTWTELCTDPPSRWHPGSRHRNPAHSGGLGELATTLLARAANILGQPLIEAVADLAL